MHYTEIKFYNVPYTEDCRYVPPNSELPDSWTPIPGTKILTDKVYPDTKDIFSKLTLSVNYNDIINCNYLSAKYHPSNGDNDYTVYAWIDSIIPQIDDSNSYSSLTTINFHLDYWRMYIEKIKIKEGLILNRVPGDKYLDPPQNVPYIYEYSLDYKHEIPGQLKNIAWVIISYIKSNKIAKITYPVNGLDPFSHVKFTDAVGAEIIGPSLSQTISGEVFNALGIAQDKQLECFLSPIAPVELKEFKNDVINIAWPSQNIVKKWGMQNCLTKRNFIKNVLYTGTIFTGNNGYLYQEKVETVQIPKMFSQNTKIRYDNQTFSSKGSNRYEKRDIKSGNTEEYSPWPVTDIFENFLKDFLNKYAFRKDDYFEIVLGNPGERARVMPIHWDHFNENTEYMPFIIVAKQLDKETLDNANVISFQEAYLKQPDKELWTFKDISDITKDITEFNPQEIIDKNKKVVSLVRTDLNLYAILDNGDKIKVNDNDVWIPNYKQQDIGFTNGKVFSFQTTPITIDQIKYNIISNLTEYWPSITNPIPVFASNDLTHIVLTDMRGAPIKRFCDKLPFDVVTTQVLNGNSGAILFRFENTDALLNDLEVCMPCTPLEVTQTYLNEYVLSGSRNAAQQNLQLAFNQSITTAATSAITGAMTGAIVSKNPIGAAIGAGLGLGSSIVNTTVGNYLGAESLKNQEEILKNKGSYLLRPLTDHSWIRNGYPIALAFMTIDDYSIENYTNKLKTFGISVNEYTYNITLNNGPLKVINALIVGNVPIEAINYIKEKLSDGIYINSELSKPANLNINTNKHIRYYDRYKQTQR